MCRILSLAFLHSQPQPHCAAHVRSQALRILYEGGITAQASPQTARLSWIWERWIYWIPERAFSPSPALSATCLEICLHYWWSPGSHYTLSAIRLPPPVAQTNTIHVSPHTCEHHLCGPTDYSHVTISNATTGALSLNYLVNHSFNVLWSMPSSSVHFCQFSLTQAVIKKVCFFSLDFDLLFLLVLILCICLFLPCALKPNWMSKGVGLGGGGGVIIAYPLHSSLAIAVFV